MEVYLECYSFFPFCT